MTWFKTHNHNQQEDTYSIFDCVQDTLKKYYNVNSIGAFLFGDLFWVDKNNHRLKSIRIYGVIDWFHMLTPQEYQNISIHLEDQLDESDTNSNLIEINIYFFSKFLFEI